MSNTMRTAFEQWYEHDFMGGLDGPGEWDEERNCYVVFGVHMAWKAWQAAQSQPAPHEVSNIKIVVDPSIPKDEAVFQQNGKEVGRITNIGESSQPAPPAPASVQEIMRLMNPYIGACITMMNARHEEIEEAGKAASKTLATLQSALIALVEKNHELQFSLDGVNAMRRPLTDEQCRDLLAAAFFIAAKDDVTVLMTDEDAERTIKLLCELSGFEPPDEIGIEPEQGGVDMRSENAARAAAKPVALPEFDTESTFDANRAPEFRATTDGYYRISGRPGLVLFKNGVEVSEPEQGEVKS